MTSMEERVFVAGAGPIGMVAAANLAQKGIPVTVFEGATELSSESRASTFHPPTLDMLSTIGVAGDLVSEGLVAPTVQYRTKSAGAIAEFNFGAIADLTAHPYRLQSEQYKLTRIIRRHFSDNPMFEIAFDSRVDGVRQTSDGVEVDLRRSNGSDTTRRGRWLIGADGARSAVRRSADIEFEGFTWPERFLVISTDFDFRSVFPDLSSVSYVADPVQWHFLLRIPGMWRAMFPVSPDVLDDTATSQRFVRDQLSLITPDAAASSIQHLTLYRVHQRVASTFRKGRVFLAGDAAHINNPLGGMGMNGGIHDAFNLTDRLARVWSKEAGEDELDIYDRQRRLVTLEHVQKQTIENKKNLEAVSPEDQDKFRTNMRDTSADPVRAREFLMKISMLQSLKRASELA